MKRFFCVFLTFIILLGSTAVMAASATATDLSPAAEAQDWDGLIESFMAENNINPDTVTLAYYNTVTGEEHYFRGDKLMTAASVNKLPLNMYYAERLYNGEISWETPYNGLAYRLCQEYSLRYSNNDYTNALIDAIGKYPDYRRAICPYIGIDPEEMEYAFFTVNQFSAEQIMFCLKLLFAEPERYPGVMDNLLLATPGEYFEQKVDEYEIAQKYGWYVLDGHNCINCAGIVETEEPILLAIFTDNCAMGKNILGEYCALMCRYTESDIALRKAAAAAEEEARLRAEEEARRAEEEARRAEEEAAALAEKEAAETLPTPEAKPEASPDEVPEESHAGEWAARLVACLIACAVLVIAMGLVSRRNKKPAQTTQEPSPARKALSILLGLLALAATIFTISLCSRALDAKTIIMDDSSDPAAVAEEFVSLALSGRSREAEELLLGSGRLGLDSLPEDELGSMLYDALLESFSYEKLGECSREGTEAIQSFMITYLDIPSLTALQHEATAARLAQYIEAAEDPYELQAEDGSYLPEVAMGALEEVTRELLMDARDYYVETQLELRLQYSGREWKVVADDGLFAILSGNTAY